MIGRTIRAMKVAQNVKTWLPNCQKIKCSFLDYVQLLMISQVIRAMKVARNVKKLLPSCQKMKCSFLDYVQLLMIGRTTWVTKVAQNAKKWLPSHQKMKYSFLDYIQLLMISQAIRVMKVIQNAKKKKKRMKCPKCKKWWKFSWQIWLDQKLMPPGIEMLEIWKKNLWQVWHDPKIDPHPCQNDKLEIWQKLFMADFAWPIIDALPPPKKWKVGNLVKIFYCKSCHDQKLMPPPPRNERLEIWQKMFMADLAWPKLELPIPPTLRNEKLEIWQKLFIADLAWPKIDIHPRMGVDGTRIEQEGARDGTHMWWGYLGGFHPNGILCHWQLCHKPFSFLVKVLLATCNQVN